MASSNCGFLTCIQNSLEAGRWSGIPVSLRIFQFVVIHTVKGFVVVNKAEVGVFLELSCFFYDPTDVCNLMSGSSAFSKSSFHIWKFMVHTRCSSKKIPQMKETQAVVTQASFQQMFYEGTEEPRTFSHSVCTGEPLNGPQLTKHHTCCFVPQDRASGTSHLWYLFLPHSGRLPATSQLPSIGKPPGFGVSRVKNTLSLQALSTYFHSIILCPSESVAESHR